MRIGVVGTESSHVEHMVRYLNVEHRQGDARVVALAGGQSERNLRLAADGGVDRLVDEPEALLGLVDAVLVCDRDGARHREHAMPFLQRGMPVLVDKPLATSVGDAEAMLLAARRSGAPLASYSPVRWFPDTDALAAQVAADGPPLLVVATGPADPAGPHGGIWFYGIHPVDVALRLAAGPVGRVRVDRVPGAVVATGRVGDTSVVVDFIAPGDRHPVAFHALVTTGTKVYARELAQGQRYLDPGLDAFFEMLHSGRPAVPAEEMLRPIRYLAAVVEAL
ncbi:MAG: Gfo/Idh/MocA family oxidoreductase [Micromonosporaceae bacterium]|nr:Gfo/Idh/MocA family oxidoreductase [Micromonosporaceae bacterium]